MVITVLGYIIIVAVIVGCLLLRQLGTFHRCHLRFSEIEWRQARNDERWTEHGQSWNDGRCLQGQSDHIHFVYITYMITGLVDDRIIRWTQGIQRH